MVDSVVTWQLLLPPLHTRTVGRRVFFHDTIDSTQALAMGHRQDGLVVVADAQTAGRGCSGRSWHSAPGLGLWLSVSLRGAAAGLTSAGALAVRDAARSGARLAVRWPNDLVCAGRKVAGVLVEHRNGWNALGIGINVHHFPEDFPPELRETAGSLQYLTGRAWDRAALLCGVLRMLDRRVAQLREGRGREMQAEWAAACGVLGRRVRQGGITGEAAAFDEDGALLVRSGGRMHRLVRGPIAYADGA